MYSTRSLSRTLLLAAAPAFACAAGSDSQLLQISARSAASGASAVRLRADCHTAVEGDVCHTMVVWAMETGVVDNPDWFLPLTKNSSFEDFQRYTAQLSDACPEPCAARALDVPSPRQLRPPEECRTSIEGDECYQKVVWAMRAGVVANPAWYARSGLTRNSTFEDFQRHLHGTARLSHVCPEPCAAVAPQGCRTSVEGDACYEKVVWAMQKGVVERPGWYPDLTMDSSFEDFQRFLHGEARLSHICPEPCAAQVSDARRPVPAPAPEECHTSVEGDACYDKVIWAMQKGVVERPGWYPDLTMDSSFEDFQRFLHGEARLSHICPEPCAAKALPAPQECHTAVEGDTCYKMVAWAMQTGIAENPDWFAPLTKDSSFEDCQRYTAQLSDACQEPCAAQASKARLPVPAPAPEECRTSIEGDACYQKVVWAMRAGVVANPAWYARSGLTRNSTFEDFQRHLHGTARLSHVCPEPCPAREATERIEASGRPGTPSPTIYYIPEADLLAASYSGYEQTGRNCQCGNVIKEFSQEHQTLDLCAYECTLYEHCLSIGLHSAESVWFGTCILYDALCDDTNGDDANTTCANPTPNGSVSVNFNRALGACDVTNGSSPSSTYPCFCGSDLCGTNEICSTDSCAPMEYLMVEWPCSDPGIVSQYFVLSGNTTAGAPTYTNYEGVYLYWDASCNGSEGQNADRWIIDNDEPNTSVSMDLDSDGACVYIGHNQSSLSGGAPLGSSIWDLVCSGEEVQATVTITYLASLPPGALPTPQPTLDPGVPCTCESRCGAFTCYDLDVDGCIVAGEAAHVDGLAEHFVGMDTDGDGCVNQTECADYSDFDLPSCPVEPPVACDFGYYATHGTSVCVPCVTGETRRRRSSECTECPNGTTDAGDFDNCISGAYLVEPMAVGTPWMTLNRNSDEFGFEFQVGDEVIIRTRNPDYFERFTIIGLVSNPDGTFTYELDRTTPVEFNIYDPVHIACTRTTGGSYPNLQMCGCGVDDCGPGYCCQAPADPTSGTDGTCVVCTSPTPAPTVSAVGDPHLVNLQGEHFDVNHGGEFTLLRIPQAASMPAEIELIATIRPEHGKPCTTYITEVELSGTSLGGRVVQVRSYLAGAGGEASRFLGLRVMSAAARASAADDVPWVRLEDWTDMPYLLAKPQDKGGFRLTLSKTQWRSKKEVSRDGASSVAGQVEVRVQRGKFNQSTKLVMRQDLPMQEHLNLAVRQLSALGRSDIGGLLGFDPHPESLEEVTPECQRHRDGLDRPQGPHVKPAWKTRWERIKEQRSRAAPPDGAMNDNEAAASLLGGRGMMCVCAERAHEEGPASDGDVEGVLAEFQTGRLAEATWD